MANWPNDEFKTWLKEIDASSLSQEQLKKEAIVFSEEFAEVDKKTITKVIDDFEKEHKKVLADVSHSVFEEMGGEEGKRRGRKDVPPKDYFPEDENMLKMIKSDSDLQKKCEMCNICKICYFFLQVLENVFEGPHYVLPRLVFYVYLLVPLQTFTLC